MVRKKLLAVIFPLMILACALIFFAACGEDSGDVGSSNIETGAANSGCESGAPDDGKDDGQDKDDDQDKDDGSDDSEGDGDQTGGDETVTPPHIHNTEHTSAQKATCTESGNIEYWYCAGCGKYFSDSELLNEIGSNDTVIPSKGHTPVTDAAVEANCVHTGLSEGSHCGDCGEVFVEQKILGIIPHSYDNGRCTHCGDWEESVGLSFEPYGDGYSVNGIGECSAEYIFIPSTYNGKPVLKIEDAAFAFNEQIKGVKISDGVQAVGISAFENCVNLEEVYMGDDVEEIGLSAFSSCEKLKTVVLSSGLKILDSLVFYACVSLTEIKIPASVEKICFNAFADCASLESITLHVGIAEIESGAFDGCTSLTEIIFDGTEEEWSRVVNLAEGDYAVRFNGV